MRSQPRTRPLQPCPQPFLTLDPLGARSHSSFLAPLTVSSCSPPLCGGSARPTAPLAPHTAPPARMAPVPAQTCPRALNSGLHRTALPMCLLSWRSLSHRPPHPCPHDCPRHSCPLRNGPGSTLPSVLGDSLLASPHYPLPPVAREPEPFAPRPSPPCVEDRHLEPHRAWRQASRCLLMVPTLVLFSA